MKYEQCYHLRPFAERIWINLKVDHVNTKVFLNFTAVRQTHGRCKMTILEIEAITSQLEVVPGDEMSIKKKTFHLLNLSETTSELRNMLQGHSAVTDTDVLPKSV